MPQEPYSSAAVSKKTIDLPVSWPHNVLQELLLGRVDRHRHCDLPPLQELLMQHRRSFGDGGITHALHIEEPFGHEPAAGNIVSQEALGYAEGAPLAVSRNIADMLDSDLGGSLVDQGVVSFSVDMITARQAATSPRAPFNFGDILRKTQDQGQARQQAGQCEVRKYAFGGRSNHKNSADAGRGSFF